MHPTAVINVVGLTERLLGDHTPNLNALARDGCRTAVRAVLPAVTCTAQATYITGRMPRPRDRGNGGTTATLAQVSSAQPDDLVRGRSLGSARGATPVPPARSCSWFNMYRAVEFGHNRDPSTPADGQRFPRSFVARLPCDRLHANSALPRSSTSGARRPASSSEWIAASAPLVDQWHYPTCSWCPCPSDYPAAEYGAAPRTART